MGLAKLPFVRSIDAANGVGCCVYHQSSFLPFCIAKLKKRYTTFGTVLDSLHHTDGMAKAWLTLHVGMLPNIPTKVPDLLGFCPT